jgi:hypothetical protein
VRADSCEPSTPRYDPNVVPTRVIDDDEFDDDGSDVPTDSENAVSHSTMAKGTWKPKTGMFFDSFEEAELKIVEWATSVGIQLLKSHGAENLRKYRIPRAPRSCPLKDRNFKSIPLCREIRLRPRAKGRFQEDW